VTRGLDDGEKGPGGRIEERRRFLVGAQRRVWALPEVRTEWREEREAEVSGGHGWQGSLPGSNRLDDRLANTQHVPCRRLDCRHRLVDHYDCPAVVQVPHRSIFIRRQQVVPLGQGDLGNRSEQVLGDFSLRCDAD